MKIIEFERSDEGNQFSFQDENGSILSFEYKPSVEGLWDDIDISDFDVQLLVHPFLNRECNVFSLVSCIKESEETVGYIFPVSVLDSNNFEAKRPSDNNYLFVAYQVLLRRLKSNNFSDWPKQSLGQCFESNICVCILNLRTTGKEQGLSNCIHSLRMLGYSYFTEGNGYKPISGYKYEYYKKLVPGTKIKIHFTIPPLYSDPIVDGIIRSLPSADNIVYRFVLLYQVVEFLLSKKISIEIKKLIDTYQRSSECSENDFVDNVSNVRKERNNIDKILEICKINQLQCYRDFEQSCTQLFDMVGFTMPKKGSLFYSFRNQMVHSFRHLNTYYDDMSYTIFNFEQIVLSIVGTYPY